ncbi:MAG: phosphate ABC transporter substrate-binding protein [Spirochaetales bacterium]|nr:phosphate ABC transporter substrate-binding protein [Spirochaetales bacterium]
MKKSVALCIVLVSVGSLIWAMGGGEKNYNFGGSTTVLPIFESAIEEFQKSHSGITISYEGQGSSVGISGVLEGIYSLGGSSRELKDEEKNKGAVGTAIALDGIAVVVNSDVPMDNFSLKTIAEIFSGKITNWSECGGPNAGIVVINRDEASGTRATFKELVLEKVLGKENANFLTAAIVTESNGDLVQKTGTTPCAIGYCGFGYIDAARNAGAKVVLVEGVDATVNNVLSGTYMISRKLYAVSKGMPKAGTIEKVFLDFLLSPEGQAIVKDEKFIPLP